MYEHSSFYIFVNFHYYLAFGNSHTNGYKTISHCGFDLYFLDA